MAKNADEILVRQPVTDPATHSRYITFSRIAITSVNFSFQYGSRDFPHTNGRQTVCNYNRVRELTVLLSDCDPGVKLKTTNFTYVEALSCICNR